MPDCDNAFAWSIKDSCDHFGDHFVSIGGVLQSHYGKACSIGSNHVLSKQSIRKSKVKIYRMKKMKEILLASQFTTSNSGIEI